MISLNLLPDVKKQFLKAQHTRNMIFTFSLIGSLIAIGLITIGFVAVLGMRYQINRNDEQISELQAEYAQIQNLSEILTIRNQAEELQNLHDDKPVASRLFKVLSITTPENVDLNEVAVDFDDSAMEITASTDDFGGVNTYIDTLKNALFSVGEQEDDKKIFSEIVSEQNISDDQVSVTITMSYAPAIFDSSDQLVFSVPSIETTQSARQKPLFNEPETETESNGSEGENNG